MTEDKDKAEALLEEAKEQSRKDTEPVAEQSSDNDTPKPVDAIADAYEHIDANDLSSNLTLRDKDLAALFHGLEASDRLPELGEAAAATLERDVDDTESRAAVLRLLVRIGLQEADESVIELGKQGRRQFLETDEF